MINITDEEEDEFDNFQSGFSSASNDLTGYAFEESNKTSSDRKSPQTDLTSSLPPDFDGPPPLTANDFDGPPPLTANDFDENEDFVFPSALGRTQYTAFDKSQNDKQQQNPADTIGKTSGQDDNHNIIDGGGSGVKSDTFAAFPSASNPSDPDNQAGSTAFHDTKASTTDNSFAAFANFSDGNGGKEENNWFAADFKTPSAIQDEKDSHSDDKNDFVANFDDITTRPTTDAFHSFPMASSETQSQTDNRMKQSNNDSPSYTTTPPPFDDAFTDRQDSLDIGPTAITDPEKDYADTAFGFHNYKPPNLFQFSLDKEDNKADTQENVDITSQSHEQFADKNPALSTHTVDVPDDAFADFKSTSNDLISNQDPKASTDESATITGNTTFSTSQFQANFGQQTSTQQSNNQTDDTFAATFDNQHGTLESCKVDDSKRESENKNDRSGKGSVGNSETDLLQQQSDNYIKTTSSNDHDDGKSEFQSLQRPQSTEKQTENIEAFDFGDFSSVQQPTTSKNLNTAAIDDVHDSFANFEQFNPVQQDTTEAATSIGSDNFDNFQSLTSTDIPANTKSSSTESNDNAQVSNSQSSKNDVSTKFNINDTPPPMDDMDDEFGDFKSLQTPAISTSAEDKSLSLGNVKDEENDNFSDFKTSAVHADSQKQNIVDDFDDFEGFKSAAVSQNAANDTAFSNFQSPKDNFTSNSNIPATDGIDDEFGDFKSLPTPIANAKDGSSSSAKVEDDDFSDFSDFKTSQPNTTNQKSNISPAEDDFDDFADFESSAGNQNFQDMHQFSAKDNSLHKNNFDRSSASTTANQFSQQTSNLAMKVSITS